MLNSKETLKKLHQALPNLTLDELFIILDCYTEEYSYNYKDFEPTKIWYSTSTTNGVEKTPTINAKVQNIDGQYNIKYEGLNSKFNVDGSVSIGNPDYQLTVRH